MYRSGLVRRGFLMELANALAASILRVSLKLNRVEGERLRSLISTTPSAEIRAWAGRDFDPTRKED